MNFKEILKIVDVFNKSDLTEMEIELEDPKVRIRLAKKEKEVVIQNLPQQPPVQTPPVQNAETQMQSSKTTEQTAKQEAEKIDASSDSPPPGIHVIKSPIVGTFYRAPAPGADPFVREGDQVRKGQVLCIIEAMKVMNEIESDVDGVVEKILVANGEPVEYGQPLFWIRTG